MYPVSRPHPSGTPHGAMPRVCQSHPDGRMSWPFPCQPHGGCPQPEFPSPQPCIFLLSTHPCWRALTHLSKRSGNQGLDPKAATGPGRGGPKQQQPLIAQRPGWASDSSSCLLTGLAALPATSHLPVPMGQCHPLSPPSSQRSEGQPGHPGSFEVHLHRRASLRTGLPAT